MFKISKKLLKILGSVIGLILALIIISTSILFLLTPDRIKFAKSDHYHFRLQYIYKGQSEDFGSPRYQTDYVKDVCSGAITESPIHFHDNKDQIVHVHWQDMTGGDVLKFYGVDLVGGMSGAMGLKFDELLKLPPQFIWLPIHSNSLPEASPDEQYYVYVGDKDSHIKKDFKDFLNQSVEKFIGVNSKVRLDKEESDKWQKKISSNSFSPNNLLDIIQVKAHNGEDHQTLSEAEAHEQKVKLELKEKEDLELRNNQAIDSKSKTERTAKISKIETIIKTEEELKQINNMIGNIVIFVQKEEPSSEQINARFNKLEPLSPSVCGG